MKALITPFQSMFSKDKCITDNIIVAREILNYMRKNARNRKRFGQLWRPTFIRHTTRSLGNSYLTPWKRCFHPTGVSSLWTVSLLPPLEFSNGKLFCWKLYSNCLPLVEHLAKRNFKILRKCAFGCETIETQHLCMSFSFMRVVSFGLAIVIRADQPNQLTFIEWIEEI